MKSVMVVHDMAPTVLPTGNDEDGTRKFQILVPCLYFSEKKTGGGICFQFPPSGRCILLFMAGRGGLFVFSRRDGAGGGFPRRDGAGGFFFRGGTGRLFIFSEAGRGGFFFFFRLDGTGRCVFFSRAGTERLFLAVAIFLAGRGKIVTPSRQRRFKPSRQPSM